LPIQVHYDDRRKGDGLPLASRSIPKPPPGEYAPQARAYLDRLPDDDRLLEHLATGLDETAALIRGLTEARLGSAYAPGKWTIKEVLLHVADDERIYAYRCLRFARGDRTPLPGFEQDDYVPLSGARIRSGEELLEELAAVREATIALFRWLPDEALSRCGEADGHRVTVRALGWHIAGHEAHHMAIVRERYLGL